MKKDPQLESAFDEYFDGASVPESVTDGAKNYIKGKKQAKSVWKKIAPAAACFLLVAAVAAYGVYSIAIGGAWNAPPDMSGESSAPSVDENDSVEPPLQNEDEGEANGEEDPAPSVYTAEDLTSRVLQTEEAVSYCSAAAFLRGFTQSFTAYFLGEELVLLRSELSLDGTGNATVYIELAQDKVYAPLLLYGDGTVERDGEIIYLLTQTAATDGTVSLIMTETDGVKVYFEVFSADGAYLDYLRLISP